MADEWQEYVNDTRQVCKYGLKCYQKNPEHHKHFKHPPPPKRKEVNRQKRRYSPYTRNAEQASSKKTDEDVAISSETSKGATDSVVASPKEDKHIDLPDDIAVYDKDTDRSILKELFLVEMPDDFFKFYEFLSEAGKPEELLASVNLELIGPYELMLGKLPILTNKELYLIHWRYFYDPPEFQAVLKKKSSEYHIGYFRDDPEHKSPFLASNDSSKGYHITLMSKNIFGAVFLHLQDEKKKSPFTAMSCQKLMDKLKKIAEENNISLEEYSMKQRICDIITKTFHGAGIVVPYNKKTQVGYRRLAETDVSLKKAFDNLQKSTSQEEKEKVFSDLQVVITNASIALDEGDFGTGLELGIALFCSGLKELQAIALSNLTAAYGVLSRKPFAQIAEAHLKCRRKGPNMSLLSSQK